MIFSVDLHMGSPVHMHPPEPDTLRVDVVNGSPLKQNYNCAHGYVTVASIKNDLQCGPPHGLPRPHASTLVPRHLDSPWPPTWDAVYFHLLSPPKPFPWTPSSEMQK